MEAGADPAAQPALRQRDGAPAARSASTASARSTGSARFGRAELAAAGALVDYVELTQQGKAPLSRPPRRLGPGAVMEIDAATRRNLELTQTSSGERRGSLLATIDRTVTGPARGSWPSISRRR